MPPSLFLKAKKCINDCGSFTLLYVLDEKLPTFIRELTVEWKRLFLDKYLYKG